MSAADTTDKTPSQLSGLQVVVGLIAGTAGLIYVLGGALLGLRLLWSDLPGLVVAQLPREFLFSFGAAQVVVPAAIAGTVIGLFEIGQHDDALLEGHQPWGRAMKHPRLRKTYVAFYLAMPLALTAPATIVALLNEDGLSDPVYPAVVVGAVTLLALLWWHRRAYQITLEKRRSDSSWAPVRGDADAAAGAKGKRLPRAAKLTKGERFEVFGLGLLLTVAFAIYMSAARDKYAYVAVIGVWFVSLLISMLALWIRGQVGERYRAVQARGSRPAPVLGVLSWSATAVLAVPAIVAVVAVWPLRDAVVCGVRAKGVPSYDAAGRFIGETGQRVYVGTSRRIVSVPSAKVSRVLIGPEAADTTLCDRTSDPPS